MEFVDLTSNTYEIFEDSALLNWHPNERAMVIKNVSSNQRQIIYTKPNESTEVLIFNEEDKNQFGYGSWSPNGEQFVYSVINQNEMQNFVYVWDNTNQTSELVVQTKSDSNFQNITWLPNSAGFYFTLGRESLQFYEIQSKELIQITTSTLD